MRSSPEMNIYKKTLKANLPRLVNLYNLDPASETYGYGDRLYAKWKISDFVNGTYQGGAHSLAIAYKLGLTNNTHFTLQLIDNIIGSLNTITSKNGSLSESYPNESSFCVTALVAFDLLSACQILKKELSKEKLSEYYSLVEPLINFVRKNDEEHAIISNHIATAVAALVLWQDISNEDEPRIDELLEIIYSNQSLEGWYMEYEGPDPGYQTLCTYYLVAANLKLKDDKLTASLNASFEFLQYFTHPDGSIGGLYGSRNTEVYYPGGLVASPANLAAQIKNDLSKGNEYGSHILPQDIDINNYIPLLNSYAFAALHKDSFSDNKSGSISFYETIFTKDFPQAGIYIHSNQNYYAIVNYKKGGTLKVFNKNSNLLDLEDGGLYGILKNGKKFSTQVIDQTIKFIDKKLSANFYTINESYPSPIKFILLRILSITIFRSVFLNNMFKKMIVSMLMTGKNRISGQVNREFNFNDDKITIKEKIIPPKNSKTIEHLGKFTAIHMASSGYSISNSYMSDQHAELVSFESI